MNCFTIRKIEWERIFLRMEIEAAQAQSAEFYLENGGGLSFVVEGEWQDSVFCACINIACVHHRSFLPNGRWRVAASLPDGRREVCRVSVETAYRLEEATRVFRYAQEQMAYTVTFGVCESSTVKIAEVIDEAVGKSGGRSEAGGDAACSSEAERDAGNAKPAGTAEQLGQSELSEQSGNNGQPSRLEQPELPELYMDSYFMQENRKWNRRRYVKEVRGLAPKAKRSILFLAILFIRAIYHIAYTVTPKRGDRVMLMSETKEVLWGNLKYIDDRIKERGLDKKFKLTYSYRSAAGESAALKNIGSWLKVVAKVAAQDFIFVDDYAMIFGFFSLGKKTRLIQVWHSGEGFKSVGYSRFGKAGSPYPEGSCHKKYTHVITGSEHLTDVFREVFPIEREAFYPVGMPRLDGFLSERKIADFKREFYEDYPQLRHRKIILFAPTYRGATQDEAHYDYDRLDMQQIAEFCRKNNYAFLIKMHPFVKNLRQPEDDVADAVFEFSGYPDINSLYYVTDILITDYSSNYFEYAMLRRPVVFYTYDREIYELTRGVHRSVKENAPGRVCDTFEQLMEALESGELQQDKIEQFADRNFGNYTGNAADRVIDEILLKEERR